MIASINRQQPNEWQTVMTSYETRELWKYIKSTSTNRHIKLHSFSLFTPIFSHFDVSTFMEVILRLTKIGRDATGCIIIQRILKLHKEDILREAIEELKFESISTKRSREPLLSYGQILQSIVNILSLPNERILSPSGERRLQRNVTKQEEAKRLFDPFSNMNEEEKKHLNKPPTLVFKHDKKKTRNNPNNYDNDNDAKDNASDMDTQMMMDRLEIQRREKEIERTRSTCGLCELAFPLASMPSSITKGKIYRTRKEWFARSTAGVSPSKDKGLSQTEKLRFAMRYGGVQNNQLTTNGAESLVKPINFQVSQVRRPLCVLCHDLLGRNYSVTEIWQPEDPSPEDAWLILHGITHNIETISKEKHSTKRNLSPRRLPKLIQADGVKTPQTPERKYEIGLGIYSDDDVSDDGGEEDIEGVDLDVVGEEEEEIEKEIIQKRVSTKQMQLDLEILLAEQKLLHSEIEDMRKMRIEVSLRRKKVNDARRKRLKDEATRRGNAQFDFFGGTNNRQERAEERHQMKIGRRTKI